MANSIIDARSPSLIEAVADKPSLLYSLRFTLPQFQRIQNVPMPGVSGRAALIVGKYVVTYIEYFAHCLPPVLT